MLFTSRKAREPVDFVWRSAGRPMRLPDGKLTLPSPLPTLSSDRSKRLARPTQGGLTLRAVGARWSPMLARRRCQNRARTPRCSPTSSAWRSDGGALSAECGRTPSPWATESPMAFMSHGLLNKPRVMTELRARRPHGNAVADEMVVPRPSCR